MLPPTRASGGAAELIGRRQELGSSMALARSPVGECEVWLGAAVTVPRGTSWLGCATTPKGTRTTGLRGGAASGPRGESARQRGEGPGWSGCTVARRGTAR
jgi:hypothetical protein